LNGGWAAPATSWAIAACLASECVLDLVDPGLWNPDADRVEEGVAGRALQLRDTSHPRAEGGARGEVGHTVPDEAGRCPRLVLHLLDGGLRRPPELRPHLRPPINRPDTDAGRQVGKRPLWWPLRGRPAAAGLSNRRVHLVVYDGVLLFVGR